MENLKYEIIAEGARKRVKALRSFYCQDKSIRIGDLGGYVRDDSTLSQDGTCWIASGALEGQGTYVTGEALVDIGTGAIEGAISNVTLSGTTQLAGTVTIAQPPAGASVKAHNSRIILAYQAAPAAANIVRLVVTRTTGAVTFDNSEVLITASGVAPSTVNLACTLISTTATINAAVSPALIGRYAYCKDLKASLPVAASLDAGDERIIATRVDGFDFSVKTLPNITEFRATPLTLTDCTVKTAIFRHNPVCNNVYSRMTFIGSADLGSVTGNYTLVTSETEGTFRLWNTKGNVMSGLVSNKDNLSGDVTVSTTGVQVLDGSHVMASGAGTIELSGNVHISGKATVACMGSKSTLKGNISIGGNASTFDSSIVGTAFLGDRASLSQANISGEAYMLDDADITAMTDTQMTSSMLYVCMAGNAKITIGSMFARPVGTRITMYNDTLLDIADADDLHSGRLVMRDYAKAGGLILTGDLSIDKNAKVTKGTISGDVTVTGNFAGELGVITDKRTVAVDADKTSLQQTPTRYDI